MHVSAEEGRQRSVQNGLDTLSACINSLDSRLDKQRFLEYNHTAFMIPKKLEFQGQKQEEVGLAKLPIASVKSGIRLKVAEPEIQKVLHLEMESRLSQLQQRVTSLRAESEEVWKTLETAESTLLEMLNAKDYDCTGYFGENATPACKPPETASIKLRADRQETEEFYLTVSASKLPHNQRSIETQSPELCAYLYSEVRVALILFFRSFIIESS
jgi:SLIT-ROBO Rho GTPase activating protein